MVARLFFAFLLVLVLFGSVLGTFFSGDDFFHFKVANESLSRGIVYTFGFHPFAERSIAFYRPLSREILYGVYYRLFGLNHQPIRVFQFLILFANMTLAYFLIRKIFKDQNLAFLTALFVGISAANIGILYYLAGGIQILMASTFFLLTLILFINNHRTMAYFAFLAAIFSHELAHAAAPLIFLLEAFVLGKPTKSSVIASLPFFATSLAFIYLEFRVIGFSGGEIQYQPSFEVKSVINTLSWYLAWAFGLPEMLIDFVRPGLKLDPHLLKFWGGNFAVIFSSFFVSLVLLLYSAAHLLFKRSRQIFDRKFLFLLIWFPLGIFPLLFLPLHKSTYYLAVSLPAFWGAIFFLAKNSLSYLSFAILIAALTVLSVSSVQIGKETYWASQRGRFAERILFGLKQQYPTLPEGAVVYFKNDPNYPFIAEDWGGSSKQAFFILSGDNAAQLLYKDNSIRSYYEDLGSLPEEVDNKEVYPFVVEIYDRTP